MMTDEKNGKNPEEEKSERGSEGRTESAPSLDLLLYDGDDVENSDKYGSDSEYNSILGEYKEKLAFAFGATEKDKELPEEEEEAPTLVKHKEMAEEQEAKEALSDIPEEGEDEELIPELLSALEDSSEKASVEEALAPEDGETDEGGEQLELDILIPEGVSEDSERDTSPSSDEEKQVSEIDSEPKPRRIDSVFDVIELFLFTLTAVILLTNFVFRHSEVTGSSMEKTLHENDHLIISDLFYTPDYGDIIVFTSENTDKPLIKRVVALEGDKVDFLFADGRYLLYVNGELMEEEYAYIGGEGQVQFDVKDHIVGKGKVFVLGDHRNNSTDSRNPIIGDVDTDRILGKVILRFYPFDSFGKVE